MNAKAHLINLYAVILVVAAIVATYIVAGYIQAISQPQPAGRYTSAVNDYYYTPDGVVSIPKVANYTMLTSIGQ